MGLAHFSIGTATDRIDLLRNIRSVNWEPSETPIEDTFASSALAEGRQLVSHRYLNAVEDVEFTVIAPTQDKVIQWSQDLRRMLRRAREYWDTEHQPDIVYIQAKASCETNHRYCWIYKGDVPRDNDPHNQPFHGQGVPRFWERHMIVERGAWQANPPGTGTAVAVEGSAVACFPNHLEFDGVNDQVNCASDAKLDDLPAAAFTVEAWIRPSTFGGSPPDTLSGVVTKITTNVGWHFSIESTVGLAAGVECAAVDANAGSGLDEFSVDGDWHYVMMCYDHTGAGTPAAQTIYLNIDGAWVTTYLSQQQGNGLYSSAAAQNLFIGWNNFGNEQFDGDIGWVRVSDSIRHDPAGADFTPPDRCILPDIDANTMGQWIKEGIGTAVANQAGGTGATANFSTWDCDCPHTFGYVPPPTEEPDWWDPADEGLCIWAAYKPKGAADYASSKLDLSGNGNHCTDGAAFPTWDAVNGWIFNNVAADYLVTTFVCASDQSQTILVQFTNGASQTRAVFGSSDTGAKDCWIKPYALADVVAYANGGEITVAPRLANGNLAIAGAHGFRNGLPEGGAIPAWAGATTKPIWIGALSTAVGNQWWGEIQAFAIYDCVLTDSQLLNVASAMAAL